MELVSMTEKGYALNSFIYQIIGVPVVCRYWGCRGDDVLKVVLCC